MSSITPGRSRLLLALMFPGLLVLFAAGCRTAPIENVHAKVDPAPLDVRHQQIVRAVRMQGWAAESPAPGIVVATKRNGRHTASSTIEFDRDSYSITLRNSSYLKQSGDTIHKVYNVWIKALEQAINRETSSAFIQPAVATQPPDVSR